MRNSKQRDEISKLAHGKWDGILEDHGFTEEVLRGKHTICPMCGGTDRFRYDDKYGHGNWICNQCGVGDGFDLLMAVFGRNFKDTAKELRDKLCGYTCKPPKRGPNKDERRRIMKGNINLWKEAGNKHKMMLDEYLLFRGLSLEEVGVVDLRVHTKVPYYDDTGTLKEHMPCMLARISSRDGKLAALHRTYLHLKDGAYTTKKKISKTSREWGGGAIRLFSTKGADRMIVAEGIETALSVRARIHRQHNIWIPCWAAVSAGNMEKMAIPEHIKQVIVAGDNDASYTGQKAAFVLANRLTVHDKRKVQVEIPLAAGWDFNDILTGRKAGG